ncbi:NAD(P)/FAD-dependent oxidoreductase [Acinetobacter sp. ABJ_C1_1]|uniref:NAD(P)/FAD-dependent oxidoreductase n=1 Tax=Acinetobacter sp. ABJ_C1_1 TaxID=3378321 RepID=UPI00264E15CB|nr:FAD-binding oxidoreductase [Acinetobacter baumannii]
MPHVVIAGAGIVGLSCAWYAQRNGWTVTLVDKDFEGDRASHGNAGGIAISECIPLSLAGLGLKPLKWLLDPVGPLSIRPSHLLNLLPWYLGLRKVSRPENFIQISKALADLNAYSLNAFEEMLKDIGLENEIHHKGALTVYEKESTFKAESRDWEIKRSHGVKFREVNTTELIQLEPNLSNKFEMGVMIEDWAHINDPLFIVQTLRKVIQQRGGEFIKGTVTSIAIDRPNQAGVVVDDLRTIYADKAVIATGAWSKNLASSIGDNVLIESERGYNTTLPQSAKLLNREVIFAERMFVATPLSIGLRIGGAAEFAGLNAAPNFKRSDALLSLGRNFIQNLDETNPKKWMGNRPTTADSLPVIGPSGRHKHVLYAFGHGHLGLTQSASTAQLLFSHLNNDSCPINPSPYLISRFG